MILFTRPDADCKSNYSTGGQMNADTHALPFTTERAHTPACFHPLKQPHASKALIVVTLHPKQGSAASVSGTI